MCDSSGIFPPGILKGEPTISRVLYPSRDWRSSISDRRHRRSHASTSGKDGPPCIPDMTCTGRGLLARTCRQAAGELLPHPHTLTRTEVRAVWFLCTFHRLAPPGSYPASCPLVLGLSSARLRQSFGGTRSPCPLSQHVKYMNRYFFFKLSLLSVSASLFCSRLTCFTRHFSNPSKIPFSSLCNFNIPGFLTLYEPSTCFAMS